MKKTVKQTVLKSIMIGGLALGTYGLLDYGIMQYQDIKESRADDLPKNALVPISALKNPIVKSQELAIDVLEKNQKYEFEQELKKYKEEAKQRDIKEEEKRLAELKRKEELKKQQAKSTDNFNGKGTVYEVTFYTAYCEGCNGVTSTGHQVTNTIYYQGYRIIAMPKHIPFYTKFHVTLQNGTSFKAIVLDRGGAIVNNKADILVSSRTEAYKLGRQKATFTKID